MTSTILVVGLAVRSPDTDWESLVSGRTIIARQRSIAERVLPTSLTINHAYDNWFEQESLQDVETQIANDLVERSKDDNIAFVVPGLGWLGDAIVATLAATTEVTITPDGASVVLEAHTQVVDGLLLAQAEERAPFDAGSHSINPTLPAVIYNLNGLRVRQQATARLTRIYGNEAIGEPDAMGRLQIAARDPMDGPPSFAALEYITARLRRPDGCPWDRKQTHASMLDDFASEVAEYAEAVNAEDWENAAEELGDVLLNVLMQVQIGTEAGHFRMEDVLTGINSKLVRRHPHVFAGVEASTPDEVLAVWNSVKAQEKSAQS